MTVADVYAAAAAVVADVFADSRFVVRTTPPDAAAAPAVWVELVGGAADVAVRDVVELRVIAVAANTPHVSTLAQIADAADRFAVMWRTPGAIDPARRWAVELVELGGVDHTAAVADLTIPNPDPCP